MTSVMHNPENFPDPEKFIPDRFITDGEFVNDVRVCVFSLGLRNCVGKQLAVSEYFIFSADIIRHFRLEKIAGSMEPAEHTAILLPKGDMRIKFHQRT